ncbi:AraC-like DNA-binding protein [Anaerotaenia torta]|uniref:helix-turn-helix domain-containing protein n=1 Tax=Anaerotaenia torta TaxID=433293 RepID=UPI003D1BCFDE
MFQYTVPFGQKGSLICQDEHCSVYQVKDETGEGQVTCYPVFPGIVLYYSDFHMEACDSGFQASGDVLSINHCREGRMEWEFQRNQFIYLETGDLQISSRHSQRGRFCFPLRHYHGLTVSISQDHAMLPVTGFLKEYSIDLPRLLERFASRDKPFVIRADAHTGHIFTELYDVPEKIRSGYHKIKVMELLLFLSTLDLSEQSGERPYFHRAQVEKIREMRNFLEEAPNHHYTLEELTEIFDIGLTTMKQCFKAVYGVSIYSYMRTYRMNAAAVLLRRGNQSIGQIAVAMGYENPSKFSSAFKEVIGLTPSEYRKSSI